MEPSLTYKRNSEQKDWLTLNLNLDPELAEIQKLMLASGSRFSLHFFLLRALFLNGPRTILVNYFLIIVKDQLFASWTLKFSVGDEGLSQWRKSRLLVISR